MTRFLLKNAHDREILNIVGNICSSGYLGCSAFVICLGVVGTIFTITDLFRIIQGGRTLADDMWRRRYARGGVVSHHLERDLKLLTSILGAEHYAFLIIGAFYVKSTFLIPWLVLQGLVILMEVVIFFARLLGGGVHLFKGEVIINGSVALSQLAPSFLLLPEFEILTSMCPADHITIDTLEISKINALSLYRLSHDHKEFLQGFRDLPRTGNFLFLPLPLLRDLGFNSIHGSEPFHAILNAVVSSLLLVGMNTSNEALLLPSLTYAGSELIRVISSGIVKTYVIYSKYGFYSAGNFACIAFSVLISAMYLWFGIPQVCEEICLEKASSQNLSKKYLQLESFAKNNIRTFDDKLIKILASAQETETRFLKQLEEWKKDEELKMLDAGEQLTI